MPVTPLARPSSTSPRPAQTSGGHRLAALGALCLATVATISACGDTGKNDPTGGTGILLQVASARQTNLMGRSDARVRSASDAFWIITDLVISNGTKVPLPLAPTVFTVQMSNGLSYTGSASTYRLANACPGDALLTPGATANCAVAFETPQNATPNGLTYTTPLLTAAPTNNDAVPTPTAISVPFQAALCGLCDNECYDFLTDPNHCGGCYNWAESGQCIGGMPAPMPEGPGSSTDSSNGGPIHNGCAQGLTDCDGRCVDLQTHAAHCGACFSPVKADTLCVGGTMRCRHPQKIRCNGRCAFRSQC